MFFKIQSHRIILALLTCLFLSNSSTAQIAVGDDVRNKGKFPLAELTLLKSKTTVILCKSSSNKTLWESELSKVWKITPIKVMTLQEYNAVKDKTQFAVFSKEKDEFVGGDMNKPSYTDIHHYYELNAISFNRRGKEQKTVFARIALFRKGRYNYHLGYIKGYLAVINNYLSINKQFSMEPDGSTEALNKLKKEILYVPDYLIDKPGMFKPTKNITDETSLFSDYKYEYKLISNDDLNEKILNSKEPINYLIYVQSSSDKFISIFNSGSNELLYWSHRQNTRQVKSKDFSKLSKTISKTK